MASAPPIWAQVHTVDADGTTNFLDDVTFAGSVAESGAQTFTNPASWTGVSTGWFKANSAIGGALTVEGDAHAFNITFPTRSADYAGSVQALSSTVDTGAGAFNFTGILRGAISTVNVNTTGTATLAGIEGGAHVVGTGAGSAGTLTFGYGTSGEFLGHHTQTLAVTQFIGVRGTLTLSSSGDVVTGQGVYGSCITTVGQTGIFSGRASGVEGIIDHANAGTLPLAWGLYGRANSNGTGAITSGGGLYIRLQGNTTGLWSNAYGILIDTWLASTSLATKKYGIYVENWGGANTTNSTGMYIKDQSGSITGNVALALGSNQSPNTTAVLFVASANPVMLAAPTTIGGQSAPATGLQLNVVTTAVTSGTPILARFTGGAHTGLTIAEALGIDINLGQTVTFGAAGSAIGTQRSVRIVPSTYAAASGTQAFTTAVGLDVSNAPNFGANTSSGAVYGIRVGTSGTTLNNIASTVYSAIAVPAQAITLTATTQVTSTVGASALLLGVVTINQSGGAVTVDQAATLNVIGPPVAGASVTLTTPLALLVQAGVSKFGGLVQTVLSATGGAGLNLPHGAAPTSPVNGDMWTTTAGLFVRINGATVGPLT